MSLTTKTSVNCGVLAMTVEYEPKGPVCEYPPKVAMCGACAEWYRDAINHMADENDWSRAQRKRWIAPFNIVGSMSSCSRWPPLT